MSLATQTTHAIKVRPPSLSCLLLAGAGQHWRAISPNKTSKQASKNHENHNQPIQNHYNTQNTQQHKIEKQIKPNQNRTHFRHNLKTPTPTPTPHLHPHISQSTKMRVSTTMIATATATLALSTAGANAATPQCRPLGEIYSDGKDLCENMWGQAFTYVPKVNETAYDLAYTMWFYSNDNPNDATTARRVASGLHEPGYDNIDVCHLQSGHKDVPGPEPDSFTECHPWKENACCTADDNYSAQVLKELYGAKYHWDKCGKLSQECERFFVMEACFYQCDASAGLFRYTKPADYDPAKDDGYEHTDWRMKGMPIQGDFCDSWMNACRHDMFCADETLDFFTCPLEQEIIPNESNKDGKVLIIVLSSLAGLVVLFSCCLVRREMSGTPVFTPLNKLEDDEFASDNGKTQDTLAAGSATDLA